MDSTEKLTVYTSIASQWANVALLGLAEKKIAREHVNLIEVDIMEAKNLERSYLKINPAGTVPALTTTTLPQPLTDSRTILDYLDGSPLAQTASSLQPPSASAALLAAKLIDLVHSPALNNMTVIFEPRNDIERRAKAAGIPNTYLCNRQAVLEKYHAEDAADEFYASRWRDNSVLMRLYHRHSNNGNGNGNSHDDDNDDDEAFFRAAHAKYACMAETIARLDSHLQLPYAAGATMTTADLHLAAWMAHLLFATGTTDPAGGFERLEACMRTTVAGFCVGERLREWWARVRTSESFREVFRELR